MPTLKNPRHERFAQELAKGKSAVQAYKDAGYKPHRQSAHKLLTKSDIEVRVRELKEQGARRAGLTLEQITEMLLEDRRFARENNQAGPASQATERLAKLHGVYVERQEHTHHTVTDEPMTAEEWESQYARTH